MGVSPGTLQKSSVLSGIVSVQTEQGTQETIPETLARRQGARRAKSRPTASAKLWGLFPALPARRAPELGEQTGAGTAFQSRPARAGSDGPGRGSKRP